MMELYVHSHFPSGTESFLSYDLHDHRESQIEFVRQALGIQSPTKWTPRTSWGQGTVVPDVFLRTTKAKTVVECGVSEFEFFDRSYRCTPPHRYFVAEASLLPDNWPQKLFQIEKVLSCVDHLISFHPEFSYDSFDDTLAAIILGSNHLHYKKAAEAIRSMFESSSLDKSLAKKKWLGNRLFIAHCPLQNVFTGIGNLDKKMDDKFKDQGAKIEKLDKKMDDKFKDQDSKIEKLDSKIEKLDKKMDDKFKDQDAKIEKLDKKMDDKFKDQDANIEKLDSKVEKLDSKIEKLDTKIDGIIQALKKD